MKTTKSLQQIVGQMRKSGQKITRAFQFTAKEAKAESQRQEIVQSHRKTTRTSGTVRQQMQVRLISKLAQAARHLPDDHMSMGSVYKITFSTLVGQHDRTSEYSRGSRYSATHYIHRQHLSFNDFKSMQIIGGVVTFVGKQIEPNIRECVWIGYNGHRKQHYDMVRENGFLVGDFHTNTIEAAREHVVHLERKIAVKKMIERAKGLFYGIEHSLAVNCIPGVQNFINRTKLDKDMGYRGDYLLTIAKTLNVESYVERMIENRASQLI